MKKSKYFAGMSAIALAFVAVVLGACSSGPKAYEAIEPIIPDDQSAVVYFIGTKDSGVIWDGETPIGNFDGIFMANIAWKTTPGEHYFMVNTFNWVVTRADLEPNKRYFLKIETIPNPIPFAKDLIAVRILKPEDGEAWLKQVKTLSFTDAWRTGYAQGKALQEAREHLQEAESKSMNVDLSGIHGR